MHQSQHNDDLKQRHKTGIKGILRGYPIGEFYKTAPFISAILISCFFLIIALVRNVEFYGVLDKLLPIINSLFPSLLGFNLGGFALIVGFGNTALIETMTKPTSGSDQSVFQKLNAVFAFSILLQVCVLFVSFLCTVFSLLNFTTSNYLLADIVNGLAICTLIFLGVWAVAMIPAIVKNIFTFGQMHHFFLARSKQIKDRTSTNAGNQGHS